MFKKYVMLLPFVCSCLFGKTLVFTTAFNRADFIELQHKLFEKFLADDYEFVVINDANTSENSIHIKQMCDQLNLHCYQVPQEIHDQPYLPRTIGDNYNNPNVRHCNAVQWAWDVLFSHHEGPVMLIDSDMFLIRPFSIEKALEGRHLAGVFWGTQDEVTKTPYSYLWLALILFNNPLLAERETLCFNCGRLPGTQAICDSGGWTNLYLDKFKDSLIVEPFNYLQGHEFYCPYRYAAPELQNFDDLSTDDIISNLSKRGFSHSEIELIIKKPYTIELLANNLFLHYRAGTNYENYTDQLLSEKDKALLDFFHSILEL